MHAELVIGERIFNNSISRFNISNSISSIRVSRGCEFGCTSVVIFTRSYSGHSWMLPSLAISSITLVSDCCPILVPPGVDSFRRVFHSFLQPAPNRANLNFSSSIVISFANLTFILAIFFKAQYLTFFVASTLDSRLSAFSSRFLVRSSQLSDCSLLAVPQSDCVDAG